MLGVALVLEKTLYKLLLQWDKISVKSISAKWYTSGTFGDILATSSAKECFFENMTQWKIAGERVQLQAGDDRQILNVLRSVNRERSYQGQTKCIPTTSKNSDSLFSTHSTVEGWRHLEKMKLNEQTQQTLRWLTFQWRKKVAFFNFSCDLENGSKSPKLIWN